ncbi:hypothetical protein PC128_g13375 [Phytophthora cactorum]|nr:hypothetical protein PC128_g13375 [Phytophthora cactorum]
MLNPIEGCFRVFKAKVKAFLAVHMQRSTFGFEPLQRDAAICICYVYSRYWQVGTLQKSPLMFILLGAQHKLIYTEVTVWFLQQF